MGVCVSPQDNSSVTETKLRCAEKPRSPPLHLSQGFDSSLLAASVTRHPGARPSTRGQKLSGEATDSKQFAHPGDSKTCPRSLEKGATGEAAAK
jgi:hypothetical protein